MAFRTLPRVQPPSIDIANLSRAFAATGVAIDSLSLHVSTGQFLSILGPSGCGKSTLLRLLAGLDRPTGGTIGFTPTLQKHRIAYVFQDAHLMPWRNVIRNVALPLEIAGVAKSKRLNAAETALHAVGLGDALRRYPAQLSGGMRMRVSLARALIVEPDVLLLDEPFAALDEITRLQLDQQLFNLWQQRRMTTILVTHSIPEALFLAERVIVSSTRPMRVVLDHRVQLPDRTPAVRGSALFASQANVLLSAFERLPA